MDKQWHYDNEIRTKTLSILYEKHREISRKYEQSDMLIPTELTALPVNSLCKLLNIENETFRSANVLSIHNKEIEYFNKDGVLQCRIMSNGVLAYHERKYFLESKKYRKDNSTRNWAIAATLVAILSLLKESIIDLWQLIFCKS